MITVAVVLPNLFSSQKNPKKPGGMEELLTSLDFNSS